MTFFISSKKEENTVTDNNISLFQCNFSNIVFHKRAIYQFFHDIQSLTILLILFSSQLEFRSKHYPVIFVVATDAQRRQLCPRLLDYMVVVGARTPGRAAPVQPPELLRRYPPDDHKVRHLLEPCL